MINLKIQWKKLIVCIALPLAVGALSSLVSGGADAFETLEKPALSPPGWLFPVVWSILYVLMGIASYLVITSEKDVKAAIFFYALQLVFNFLWPVFFFGLELYLFSFVWLAVLWLLILFTAILFYRASPAAGYLIIPYLVWVTFAGYLNLSIYLLNR